MNEQYTRQVRAVVWRLMESVKLGEDGPAFDLAKAFALYAQMHGYGLDQLGAFRGAYRSNCVGFWRDERHYVGMCNMGIGKAGRWLLVRTTGQYDGVWAFALDTDRSVLANHNRDAVEEFNDLEGADLIRAVVASAFVTPLSRPSRWRRKR